MKLVVAAIVPTIIMGACFMLIETDGMTNDPLVAKDHTHDSSHSKHADHKLVPEAAEDSH